MSVPHAQTGPWGGFCGGRGVGARGPGTRRLLLPSLWPAESQAVLSLTPLHVSSAVSAPSARPGPRPGAELPTAPFPRLHTASRPRGTCKALALTASAHVRTGKSPAPHPNSPLPRCPAEGERPLAAGVAAASGPDVRDAIPPGRAAEPQLVPPTVDPRPLPLSLPRLTAHSAQRDPGPPSPSGLHGRRGHPSCRSWPSSVLPRAARTGHTSGRPPCCPLCLPGLGWVVASWLGRPVGPCAGVRSRQASPERPSVGWVAPGAGEAGWADWWLWGQVREKHPGPVCSSHPVPVRVPANHQAARPPLGRQARPPPGHLARSTGDSLPSASQSWSVHGPHPGVQTPTWPLSPWLWCPHPARPSSQPGLPAAPTPTFSCTLSRVKPCGRRALDGHPDCALSSLTLLAHVRPLWPLRAPLAWAAHPSRRPIIRPGLIGSNHRRKGDCPMVGATQRK